MPHHCGMFLQWRLPDVQLPWWGMLSACRLFRNLLATIALCTAFAASLAAQAVFPFQLVVQDQNQNAINVATASTLNLAAQAVGSKGTVTIAATYHGVNVATLAAPSLVGSPEFSIGNLTATTLSPGASATLQVNFTPTSSSQATSQLSIPFTETNPANNAAVSSGSITFTLVGSAPQFLISYYFQAAQNVTQVADGGTLTFPATLVPATSQAVVQIQNTGSAPGLISSIQVPPSAFTAARVPLLPGVLNANSTLQFALIYTPTKAGTDIGTLNVVFSDHTVTINLAGTGTAPAFVYQITLNGQVSTITPNQTIALSSGPLVPDAFTITAQNTGTGNGVIAGQSLSGVGYQQIDAPLPSTVPPGGFATFSYSFTPPQVGSFPGRVRIGNDSFALSGTGTGPQLAYLFTIGSAPTFTITTTIPFSPVQVGQSATGTFTIQDSGTLPATVISIFVGEAKSAFTLPAAPGLPLTLAPGEGVLPYHLHTESGWH